MWPSTGLFFFVCGCGQQYVRCSNSFCDPDSGMCRRALSRWKFCMAGSCGEEWAQCQSIVSKPCSKNLVDIMCSSRIDPNDYYYLFNQITRGSASHELPQVSDHMAVELPTGDHAARHSIERNVHPGVHQGDVHCGCRRKIRLILKQGPSHLSPVPVTPIADAFGNGYRSEHSPREVDKTPGWRCRHRTVLLQKL